MPFEQEISHDIWNEKYRFVKPDGTSDEKTIEDTNQRVIRGVYEKDPDVRAATAALHSMNRQEWNPGGRVHAGAGTNKRVTLINCYTNEELDDSMVGIMRGLTNAALTQQCGGGIGTDFSTLRPAGAIVRSTGSVSTGVIPFARMWHTMCSTIKSSGSRRGAMMGTLADWHPDLYRPNKEFVDFIHAKQVSGELTNFNVSVLTSDAFMAALQDGELWELGFDVEPADSSKIIATKTKDGRNWYVYTRVPAAEIWEKIIRSTYEYAEPGVIFIDRVNELNNLYYCENIRTTNPCVVGETLVAVADGRNNVPIKTLAEEGKDVPVFCNDARGELCIRIMRHPRITGYQVPVFKVNLDDGSSLQVTGNHKFALTDGTYRETSKLNVGDSLFVLTKFHARLDEICHGVNSHSSNYMWMQTEQTQPKAEHRLITGFYHGDIPYGHVVHHRDYDSLNNCPANLEPMSKKLHDQVHREDKLGDRNPMRRALKEWSSEKWNEFKKNVSASVSGEKNGRYSGVSNLEIRDHALHLAKCLGQRFSTKQWKKYALKNELPSQFSKWRVAQLGNITELSKWAAAQLNMAFINEDPRVQRTYIAMLDMGYMPIILHGKVLVHRQCEGCKDLFTIDHEHREVCYCSVACANKNRIRSQEELLRTNKAQKASLKNRKSKTRTDQVNIYLAAKGIQAYLPKKAWKAACKQAGISSEICRASSPFSDYKHLVEAAARTNHKVVSVEPSGFANVYNGTVDDFHNFFVGGFEDKTASGKPSWTYVNNLQCGEQPLPPNGNCDLGSINLAKMITKPFTNAWDINLQKIADTVTIGMRFLDNVLDVTMYPLEQQKEEALAKRRTGLGVTALGTALQMIQARYGSAASVDPIRAIMEQVRNSAYQASIELAKERGPFPAFNRDKYLKAKFICTLPSYLRQQIAEHGIRNGVLLTIAPVGTGSIYYDNVTAGIEPPIVWKGRRKVLQPDGKFREYIIEDYGWRMYRKLNNLPEDAEPKNLPDYMVTATELSVDDHLTVQALCQKYIDSSISKTINCPKDISYEDFKNVYQKAYDLGLKGCTTYRPSAVRGSVVSDEKKEETPKALPPAIPKIKERISSLFGITIKIPDGHGSNMFVTVNFDSWTREPFEVFLRDNSGNEYVEHAGRNISLLLRAGVPHKEIRQQLRRSGGQLSIFYNEKHYSSQLQLLDHIVFEEAPAKFRAVELNLVKETELVVLPPSEVIAALNPCPDCAAELKAQEGCMTCTECGYSKCK